MTFHRALVAAAAILLGSSFLFGSVSAASGPTLATRVAVLESQVKVLTVRVAALEVKPTPMPTATPSPTPAPTPTPVPTPAPCGVLQARVTAAAVGSILDLTGCSYTAGATIDKAITLVGGTITVTSGDGLDVNAAGVTIDGTVIHGLNLAFAGIWAHEANGLRVTNTTITDFTYAGIMVLSSSNGQLDHNLIQRIGFTAPQGSNAYGIALSEYSTERPTDHFVVDSNTVEDVPIWHGLDTHSGVSITFSNNVVRRVSRGLFITAAYGLAPTDITVTGNQILSPSPATYNLTPITLSGVNGITFSCNTISGWGSQSPTSAKPYYDYGGASTGIVVGPGNVVTP